MMGMSVEQKARAAREAAKKLLMSGEEEKNIALRSMAEALEKERNFILKENEKDLQAGKETGLTSALLDRLQLTKNRLEGMIKGLHQLCRLPDPVGEVLESHTREDGLRIEKARVPLGVIGMIYEARPNVTVDATGLALKAGNAILLRGSSSAFHSNQALVKIMKDALKRTAVPSDSIQWVSDPDRKSVGKLLRLHDWIDVIIPRGGAGLIQRVVAESTIPVLETGVGNCHILVDRTADLEKAKRIVINAKTDRPAVCNAAETLLVHKEWASSYLVDLCQSLSELGVEIRGCKRTGELFPGAASAGIEDWEAEFLDQTLAVKVVDSLKEGLDHIEQYGTRHSEAIITETESSVQLFMQQVDAAAVYHNASTRFTDGSQFGYGAEMGISTQKLHARGPMGLKELTSYQYRIYGEGHIRE